MSYDNVHRLLEDLKLSGIQRVLDSSIQRWSKEDKDVMELVEELLLAQKKENEQKRYQRDLQYSGLPFYKSLEEFDFAFQPSVDRKQVMNLKSLRFIHEKENVVLLGPPGVGKTHIAVSLCLEAIREGHKAYFVNAITLIDRLKKAFEERRLIKMLQYYKGVKLLVIDELGYLPLDTEGGKLFFELISQRYEYASTILTSNRSFTDWDKIFYDEVLASAVLDRLLHHSIILNIRGKSYRLKEKQKVGLVNIQFSKESEPGNPQF